MNDARDQSGHRFDLRSEWRALKRGIRVLDAQTVVVLLFAALAVIVQMNLGSRTFFRTELAPSLGLAGSGLASWTWWFAIQGILGFAIPVAILRLGFGQSMAEMGLGAGDWRFAGTIALLYLPLVAVGTWILSNGADFQENYPHLPEAAESWSVFLVYEAVFIFYWMGWEYLWRGFVLFGTAKVFGAYAIIIQTVPFAILHYEKPMPEAILSIVGGLALGLLVWRSRSFWIAVPIHAVQMILIDLFCALRIRTGASGIGFDAFWRMISGL